MLFLLWLPLFILSGVVSPLTSSGVLGTYRPAGFIFQCYVFTFSYCSWGSQGKNTKVVCHCLLHWNTFSQNSPPWPIHLGWPYRAWLILTELDKAVVHVIRLVSFLWLWFSVCLYSDEEWWGLLKLPGGRGQELIGGAMLSKLLIQFSVYVWSCVPSLLFSWGQTMVNVMKIRVTFHKRSHAYSAILNAPNIVASHHQPTPPLKIPWHPQASLGRSPAGSLLLSFGPGCKSFCCAFRESISQCCVSSGSSMVGLMATSSNRAYVIPKTAAPRDPAPAAGHCWPAPPQETLKHSNTLERSK